MSTSIFLFLFASCGDEQSTDEESSENTETSQSILTQEMLNTVTTMVGEKLVGPPMEDDANFTHAGGIRTVYTNMTDASAPAQPGDIIVKHSYLDADQDGTEDSMVPNMIFAMRKREAGYNSDMGDWEWVRIAPDATTDFSIYPNGMIDNIAAQGKSDTEGVGGCISCHSGGEDYRFVFPN